MPFYKYITNRFFTCVQNRLMGMHLSKYHAGYRGWTRNVLEKLSLEACSDGFVFDNQMLSWALKAGFRAGEISCPTRYFDEASSINLKCSIVYGLGCLKTAFHFRLHSIEIPFCGLFRKWVNVAVYCLLNCVWATLGGACNYEVYPLGCASRQRRAVSIISSM